MKKILLIAGVFMLLSCGSGKKITPNESLRAYYFPCKDMTTPQTYRFVNVNDSSEKSVWIMQTTVLNGDTLFLTQIRNQRDQVTESLVEKIGGQSASLVKYRIFSYDKNNIQTVRECTVIDSLIFKWVQNTHESILWKVNYAGFITPGVSEFSKTRTLLRRDSKNNLVVFEDYFHSSVAGANNSSDWSMVSYYQKGKGLVRFKIYTPNGVIKDFKLTSIAP